MSKNVKIKMQEVLKNYFNKGNILNSITKKSNHPHHHVIIGKNQKYVTLCIYVDNDTWDYWKIDSEGHVRVPNIEGNSFIKSYWQDYLELKNIQNIYKVLDFYVKKCENEYENDCSQDFTADDIPF